MPQNPLSINYDQAGFGADELSRGLLREPNNANTPGGLVFNQQASSGELRAPN